MWQQLQVGRGGGCRVVGGGVQSHDETIRVCLDLPPLLLTTTRVINAAQHVTPQACGRLIAAADAHFKTEMLVALKIKYLNIYFSFQVLIVTDEGNVHS